ncbi:hypothetical protein BDW22DRAFT_1362036 [Trametopsis cervina]|nr:hypothetical protein BDW22DRAFT_1362036 [Trametopsis cervina]
MLSLEPPWSRSSPPSPPPPGLLDGDDLCDNNLDDKDNDNGYDVPTGGAVSLSCVWFVFGWAGLWLLA